MCWSSSRKINGPELACYGTPAVSTPHLDQLAADGVRFDRAYVPQAGCSQSRAAYLTGLYPHVNGQIGLATWRFRMYRPDTPNLVTWLKAAVYRTGIIGKLHINPESAFPFDMHEIPSANFNRNKMGDYAKFAGQFINNDDEPFFLSVNYPDAHRPHLKQVDGLPADPLESEDVEVLEFIGIDSPTLRFPYRQPPQLHESARQFGRRFVASLVGLGERTEYAGDLFLAIMVRT